MLERIGNCLVVGYTEAEDQGIAKQENSELVRGGPRVEFPVAHSQ